MAIRVGLAAALLAPDVALAQGGPSLIRDAESETIIRALSTPIFQAAGLDPASVRIRLIEDKTLNAFVSGGQNIYLHTGLILSVDGPDALVGVIAHETGHIEGGHLVRSVEAIREASAIQLIGTLLGTASAIAAKNARAAAAGGMIGSQMGLRTFMQFSRSQESFADQAALRLLDATGRSGVGLEKFLGQLGGQEALSRRFQDPYVITHPLSKERIDTMAAHNETARFRDAPVPSQEQQYFDRMVAKLYGFLEPLNKVLKRYPETDVTFPARYARAIAYYRASDLKRALDLTDALIADEPQNAYLHELKGQMLFEHGRAQDAHAAYRKAVDLSPREPLILMELARVELELDDPALLDQSIANFRRVIQLGGSSEFVWRQLGIAYGRKGDVAMSSLALAEAELRAGQLPSAEFQATRARDLLPPGSGAHLQALDILQAIAAYRSNQGNGK